jgi:hypothetical protein
MTLWRWLRLGLLVSPFGATLLSVVWLMSANPFAAPMIERSLDELTLALDRAMERTVTQDWLTLHLQEAIAAEDLDQITLLIDLADEHGVSPHPDDLRAAAALVEAQSGVVAQTLSCAKCAIDIASCRTLSQIGTCAVPFELSPGGDLNALRRAGIDYWAGAEVDRLDLGLALVGLGATATIAVSGGSSGTIKFGTGLLRMAKRIGSLTPCFRQVLGETLRLPINWNRVVPYTFGGTELDEVTDVVKLSRLTAIAADLGRIRRNTSTTEALVLMRHIDSAEDARNLARISDAAGPRTRGVIEVLGKGRAFRTLVRISDVAFGAAVAIYATILQVLLFAVQRCANMGLRVARQLL